MSERMQICNSRRVGRWAALAGLVAIVAMGVGSSSASAACPMPSAPTTFSTSWIGGSGHYNTDSNWSNGAPSAVCDASITASGTYTVTMDGGSNAKSMTIGGPGSTPTLEIRAEGANTNLAVVAGGFLNIASGASLTLRCNPAPACGAPNVSAPTITNAGTFTVESTVNGTPFISGPLTNTGTMNFNHTAKFDNGAVTNQGMVNIANATTVLSGGSSCGDTSVLFKNDTGGSINATGTGTFDVINYEQGAGSTTGTNPVQMPCGTLRYTGNGASSVTAYGGFGLTGTMQANQSLTVTNASSNTNAVLGGNFTNNGTITLTCPASPCGGPGFNANGNIFTNVGAFTVAPAVTTSGTISGNVTNAGTMHFNGPARLTGAVTNQGAFNIADGVTVVSSGSSCGDAGTVVKNDTGGSINATGTGTLDIINYEQGSGTTSGANPVQMPCGSLKYTGTGNGASSVTAYGGFGLTGTMQANQSLTVTNASSNTNAVLGGNFTNNGTVTLTCPASPCGGPGFNANGNTFTNVGTFRIAPAVTTAGTVSGNVTNSGTMRFEGNGTFANGTVLNQGAINVDDGKTMTSTASSCGDAGTVVKNDTGGSINATGTGTVVIFTTYEQGNGLTSGVAPVTVSCGVLKYTGGGASTVLVTGGAMTGSMASGQTLRLVGGVNASPFTNAGTIVLDQSASNPNLNVGGTLTNTGTLTTTGASANTSTVGGTIDQTGASAQVAILAGTKLSLANPLLLKAGKLTGGGTLTGSVNNSGGTVAPGSSPGTLTLSGNYTQGAGGSLAIEIGGTGAGQFDKLAIGGNATLGGTLALQPIGSYPDSSAIGDSVGFLTYGGTRTEPFASTAVSPALSCPKQLAAAYEDATKKISAVVSNSGAVCPTPVEVLPVPDTVLGAHPKPKVKTKKGKAKVKFTFSASIAGATFQCKIDKGAFAPCSSPKSFKAKVGKHTFSVRAIASGVADPTPASFSFKVMKKKKR
jgi:fibronectin-binding autotransporter adhesin